MAALMEQKERERKKANASLHPALLFSACRGRSPDRGMCPVLFLRQLPPPPSSHLINGAVGPRGEREVIFLLFPPAQKKCISFTRGDGKIHGEGGGGRKHTRSRFIKNRGGESLERETRRGREGRAAQIISLRDRSSSSSSSLRPVTVTTTTFLRGEI